MSPTNLRSKNRPKSELMDTKINSLLEAAGGEVSLVRGGPFFRAQQALGLISANQWNFTGRILVSIAITWLPLVVFTAVLNPEGLPSLIRDYRVHARLLIAVPALIVGETFMESRFRLVMQHIRQVGILDPPDLASMDGVIATLVRVRDAFLPELVVFVLLVIHTATSYRGLVDATPWLGHESGSNLQLTVAGWYAVLVSAPLFQFLLGLSLWRWRLWTFFAFKLSIDENLRAGTDPSGRTWRARFSGADSSGICACRFRCYCGDRSNLAKRNPSSWRSPDGLQATGNRAADHHRCRRPRASALLCSTAGEPAPSRDSGIRNSGTNAQRRVP